MLEIVTFTGVDERTDLGEVQALMDEYPFAEFAILIGSQTKGGGNPIFPSLDVLDNFRAKLPEGRIALHLCGQYARVVATNQKLDWEYYAPARGMSRVQVNVHPDGQSPELTVDIDALVHFAESTKVRGVILQHRGAWSQVPADHPKIEYLFDRSEGAGISDFNAWPYPPQDGCRYGFAGGIGPHNIWRALVFAEMHQNARMWFDMERNVRDDNYWFDLGKVRAVCERVDQWMKTQF